MYVFVAYARFAAGEPVMLGVFSRWPLAQQACGTRSALRETADGKWDRYDDGVFYSIRRVELDRMPPTG
jgi:hypothetical protein